MKLEEAIKKCEDFLDENKSRPIILHKAIKTVLQALEDKNTTINKIREQTNMWIKTSKVEMQEYGDNHEKYWKMFQELLNKIVFELSDYKTEDEKIMKIIEEEYIPKKKIEDKLEQLNSEIQYCARQNGKSIKLGKIMALQELLEDK